jgi:hypothetical protein
LPSVQASSIVNWSKVKESPSALTASGYGVVRLFFFLGRMVTYVGGGLRDWLMILRRLSDSGSMLAT